MDEPNEVVVSADADQGSQLVMAASSSARQLAAIRMRKIMAFVFFKIVFHMLNITLYFPGALMDGDRICPVFTFSVFVFIICLILKTTSECIYLNGLQRVLDGYSREEQCGLGYLP